MECNNVINKLEEYLAGDVKGEEKAQIENHLSNCNDCKKEYDEFAKFIGAFDYLPENKPLEDSYSEFQEYIEIEKSKLQSSRFQRSTRTISLKHIIPIGIAASIAIFVFGFFSGKQTTKVQIYNEQIAELEDRIKQTNTLVMLTMLDQQSASKRLQAVNYADEFNELGPKVTKALFDVFNNDRSDNVRLAALESLSHFANDSEIRNNLIESFENQIEPMIQISLITLMVNLNEKKSVEKIQKLVDNKETTEEVKEHARKSLKVLI